MWVHVVLTLWNWKSRICSMQCDAQKTPNIGHCQWPITAIGSGQNWNSSLLQNIQGISFQLQMVKVNMSCTNVQDTASWNLNVMFFTTTTYMSGAFKKIHYLEGTNRYMPWRVLTCYLTATWFPQQPSNILLPLFLLACLLLNLCWYCDEHTMTMRVNALWYHSGIICIHIWCNVVLLKKFCAHYLVLVHACLKFL